MRRIPRVTNRYVCVVHTAARIPDKVHISVFCVLLHTQRFSLLTLLLLVACPPLPPITSYSSFILALYYHISNNVCYSETTSLPPFPRGILLPPPLSTRNSFLNMQIRLSITVLYAPFSFLSSFT
jgi:hypothetical protein